MMARGKENAIEPDRVDGNRFTFSGKLKTPVGMTKYTCEGEVSGDESKARLKQRKAICR